jgi:fatty-acyl-CoA synthase
MALHMALQSVTMDSWVARHAQTRPRKVALVFQGRRITYGELEEQVARTASGLCASGVRKGDRVAALLPNGPEFLEILLACTRIGAIFVPINTRLAPAEVLFILQDSMPEMLVCHEQFMPQVQAVQAKAPVRAMVQVGGTPASGTIPYEELGAGEIDAPVPLPSDPNDPAVMMYTSGTTGRPKGALLTHANLLWNNIQVLAELSVGEDDINFNAAPLFHIGGLNVLTGPILYCGATNVLEDRFDPRRALELMEAEHVTCSFAVPAMWNAIAQVPDFDRYDLSHVRFFLSGGAPCPLPLIEFFRGRGLPFQEGFGLTETAPVVAVLKQDDVVRKAGSIGKPALHVEVRIVDDYDREVRRGEIGELVVRGPNVMLGYWNQPEATAEAVRGGWFHTGDLARQDDEGYLFIVDRKKDMIITGGENVYPVEVEQVLVRHPRVQDVAVFGIPDAKWGERVVAAVVTRDGQPLSTEEVQAFCSGKLARFKVPSQVHVLPELPRNATGKVLKTELRRRFGGTDRAVTR